MAFCLRCLWDMGYLWEKRSTCIMRTYCSIKVLYLFVMVKLNLISWRSNCYVCLANPTQPKLEKNSNNEEVESIKYLINSLKSWTVLIINSVSKLLNIAFKNNKYFIIFVFSLLDRVFIELASHKKKYWQNIIFVNFSYNIILFNTQLKIKLSFENLV